MLPLKIALRFLRRSPVQTALIVAGVAVGLGVQVFVGSLITSLQSYLLDQTLGSSSHVTLVSAEEGGPVRFDSELEELLGDEEGIVAVAPVRSVSVIFSKGSDSAPLSVKGGETSALDSIYSLEERVVEGEHDVSGDEALVGLEFAQEYGVYVGDSIDVLLPGGQPDSLEVAGVFDLGSAAANRRLAFTAEGFAGEALGLEGGEYSAIETQLGDVFTSSEVARRLAGARSDLDVVDWQVENADLLQALSSQGTSSYMIQFFVVVAVALGIASTLAISAIQKTRQIGILKALGMSDAGTGVVFLWQGLILGGLGSAGGIALGLGLVSLFGLISAGSDSSLFDISPPIGFVVVSAGIGVTVAMASAIVPYRKTSRLDPIEVIQRG
jgi:lipoprotein-releasing system permease protein